MLTLSQTTSIMRMTVPTFISPTPRQKLRARFTWIILHQPITHQYVFKFVCKSVTHTFFKNMTNLQVTLLYAASLHWYIELYAASHKRASIYLSKQAPFILPPFPLLSLLKLPSPFTFFPFLLPPLPSFSPYSFFPFLLTPLTNPPLYQIC